MENKSFNLEEFIEEKDKEEQEENTIPVEGFKGEKEEELDVQKVVVEELAADKVRMEREIEELKLKSATFEKNLSLMAETLANKEREIEEKKKAVLEEAAKRKELQKAMESLRTELETCKTNLRKAQEKEFDTQERNPNALALLDREVELPDRFPGETRDHVIEAVKEAQKKAEEEGKCRKAQVLEAVLVANEPNGTLAARRKALEEVFARNNNLVTGEVIEYLGKLGISHMKGEEYLTPAEIENFYY